MLKTFDEIVHAVYQSLIIDGVQWSINGKRGYVTQENVKDVIQNALTTLYGNPPASSVIIGGILIYKWDEDKYDIYVRKGEYVKDNQYNDNGSTA